jgi:cytochrome c biogenesis protein
VLKNYPGFEGQKGGPFSFALLDYQQKQYTGLQVKKDPGVWVVWLGCALLVLGSIAAFSLSHRRLWARIEPDGTGAKILLGGNAHRNQPGFALYFDDLKQRLDEAFRAESSR